MINKETHNQSFINMWRHLQDMKVENNSFMLELHDESLKNFRLEDLATDDKSKRIDLMNRITFECQRNIWFFFRELIRIPNPIAFHSCQLPVGQINYILNPTELNMIYAYEKGINLITKLDNVPKGIRTTLRLLEFYSHLFGSQDDNYVISYDDDSIDDNLRYYMIRNANFSTFPMSSADITNKSYAIRTDAGFNIHAPEKYYKNIFLHVDKEEYNKENFYKTLFDMMSRNNLHTIQSNIHGYIVKKEENLSTYEKMIERMMFDPLPITWELYDNPDMVTTKNKIYFQ